MRSRTFSRLTAVWGLSAVMVLAACGDADPEAAVRAAEASLAQGQSRSAIVELKDLLQKHPDSAGARVVLGRAFMAEGDSVSAAIELEKASALGAPPDAVAAALARTYLDLGRPQDALRLERNMLPAGKAALAAFLAELARAQASLGDMPSAEALVGRALEADPNGASARLAKAGLLAAAGDIASARPLADAVLAGHAGNVDALALGADLDFAAGQPDAGVKKLRQILAQHPADLAAHARLMEHLLDRADLTGAGAQLDALRKERPKHSQTVYFSARLAAQQKDLNAADEHVKQLLKRGVDAPVVLQLAGVVALQRGELAQADQHLSKLHLMLPDAVGPRQLVARVALARGDAPRALVMLQPMLGGSSVDTLTLSLAGTAQMQAGNYREAEELFARAGRATPGEVRTATAQAMARLARNDVSALGQLDRIARADTSGTADLALITASLSRKDFQGALRAAQRAVAGRPGDAVAHYWLGEVLLARGDPSGARTSFEKSASIDARFFASSRRIAELDLQEGKMQIARARIARYLDDDPKNAGALFALAQLDERAGKPRSEVLAGLQAAIDASPNDARLRVQMIEFHLRGGDRQAALTTAQRAIGVLPSDPQVMEALARIQLATGNAEQALAAFNQLASLQPRIPEPLLGVAHAQLARKNVAAALLSIQKALALSPEHPEANRLAVLVLVAAGRHQDALTLAQSVRKRQPARALGDELVGDVARLRGRYGDAVSSYQAAFRKEPTSAYAQLLHGSLASAGQSGAARDLSRTWLESHPRDLAFLRHLMGLAAANGDDAGVETAARQVISVDARNADALNNLAWSLHQQKKTGALALAEQANEIHPGNPNFLNTLATLLAEGGRVDAAIELQQQAVAKAADVPTFRLTLAKLYLESGKRPQAKEELEKLRALGTSFAAHEEVARLLAAP